jgi:predicted nucleic acid-binding Zn ribbon protein
MVRLETAINGKSLYSCAAQQCGGVSLNMKLRLASQTISIKGSGFRIQGSRLRQDLPIKIQ